MLDPPAPYPWGYGPRLASLPPPRFDLDPEPPPYAAPHVAAHAAWPAEAVTLDPDEFDEIVDVDVDEDLDATSERACAWPADPSGLRYVVEPGPQPGELLLRGLAPGEPPPFGVPIVTVVPSCSLDGRLVMRMLGW